MKYIIPVFLVFLFIFSITLGTVSAWYETDESDKNKNYYYANTDWINSDLMYDIKDGDFFTNSDVRIQNLEPGYYVVYDADHPIVAKYDTLGTLQWLEISDYGSPSTTYGGELCVDNDYDIYISTASGAIKIDGTDGDVLWTCNDFTGYGDIYKMKISTDSKYLLVYSGSNGRTAILNTEDGSILNDNVVDIANVNDFAWTYDNKLVLVTTSGWYIYGLDLTQDEEGAPSNAYTGVYINHYQDIDGFTTNNTDFIYVVSGGQLKCNSWTNNTLFELWSYDHSSLGNIVTNVVHNDYTNHVYYGLADGTPSSAVPMRIICLSFNESTSWTTVSNIWESANITGTHLTSGTLICDYGGDVVFSRYGSQSLYCFYNATGLTKQTLTMSFEFWTGMIYDNENDRLITVERGAANDTSILQYLMFNGTHIYGENRHVVIIPEELDEETWDWILFTILIVAISAIGAATAFNGFSQTGFLCFLNINIFIGCWYDIYPIELIVLPMAILAIVIFRTAGDVTE